MTELVHGKQSVDHALETTFEEADKRIKLLVRPGEMKARLEHFKKEAEDKLPPLPVEEPLIKIWRNLHPPFLGEALQYMREFHKNYSANDLYGLPKACQDTIDLVLTCPDAERIIQKNSDLGLKARFQHIREARVLGFSVDPYTDINPGKLPFSLEDLQYLRYHFEVFSAVSLFGLTADEIRHVERLDAYLDIRDARIAYQEQTRVMAQVTDSVPVPEKPKACEPEKIFTANMPETLKEGNPENGEESTNPEVEYLEDEEENPENKDREEEDTDDGGRSQLDGPFNPRQHGNQRDPCLACLFLVNHVPTKLPRRRRSG